MEEQDGELYQEEIIEHEEIKDDTPDVIVPGEALHDVHKEYLRGRGLDPEWLIKEYGVTGTTYYPEDYKKAYRIHFPIRHKGKIVSYVGRSYLPDAMNKYNCCEKEDELYFHKHLLFGQDKVTERKGIIVEGPTDQINLYQASGNPNICATYGTSFKDEQLIEMRKLFDEVFIIYDPEPAAQEKAMKIISYMESYGKKATNLKLKLGVDMDPGKLPQPVAKFIVEKYLGKEK
jgi:5S rRNA maturation endonuclease (ribonuclease M5)